MRGAPVSPAQAPPVITQYTFVRRQMRLPHCCTVQSLRSSDSLNEPAQFRTVRVSSAPLRRRAHDRSLLQPRRDSAMIHGSLFSGRRAVFTRAHPAKTLGASRFIPDPLTRLQSHNAPRSSGLRSMPSALPMRRQMWPQAVTPGACPLHRL